MSMTKRVEQLEKKSNVNDDEIKKITVSLVNMDGSIDTVLVTHKRGNVWTKLQEEKISVDHE